MRYVRAVPGLRQELMARSFRLIRRIAWVAVALLMQLAVAPAEAAEEVPAEVVLRALALVNAPYRYGGRTPAGFGLCPLRDKRGPRESGATRRSSRTCANVE